MYPVLTFAKVASTKEVDTDYEKDHNRDVDGHVIELIFNDQLLFMGNYPFATHIAIPVCDQNRTSSDFTRNTNSSGLRKRKAVSMLRE